jgi:hypothetical protein
VEKFRKSIVNPSFFSRLESSLNEKHAPTKVYNIQKLTKLQDTINANFDLLKDMVSQFEDKSAKAERDI